MTSSESTTESCRVCGGSLRTILSSVADPLTQDVFSIGECRECGLKHTLPQPDDPSRYYGERYYGNRHGPTARFCLNRRLGFVRNAVGKNKMARLLDVGCGDGSFLLAAQREGWEVAGVEINPEPARRAGLHIVEAIPQAHQAGPFDCITLWHSLEHMPDINAMMQQLRKLLNRDGTVIIAVPNNNSLQAKVFGKDWLALDVPRHLYHFDPQSLSRCMEQNGFAVQRIGFQEFEYDLMGWSQSALNGMFSESNVFIDRLMGKPSSHSAATQIMHFVLGSLSSAIALPLVLIEKAIRRSGTFIIAAKKT